MFVVWYPFQQMYMTRRGLSEELKDAKIFKTPRNAVVAAKVYEKTLYAVCDWPSEGVFKGQPWPWRIRRVQLVVN